MEHSLRRTINSVLFLIGVLSNVVSAQYLNESVMLYLDVTVYTFTGDVGNLTDIELLDDMVGCFEATGNTPEYHIYDMDLSQTLYLSDYIYWDETADLQCSFRVHLFFESQHDYELAIYEYESAVLGNLATFISGFETNIHSELSSEFDIEMVSVNSLKVSKRNDDDSGRLLIDYHSQNDETSTTPNTDDPESTISTSSTGGGGGDGSNDNDSKSHLFKEDWPYWVILIAFLMIGCCFGGCCWWYCCNKLRDWLDEDTLDRFDSAKYSYSARLSVSNKHSVPTTTEMTEYNGADVTDHEEAETNGAHNGAHTDMPPGDPVMQHMTSTPVAETQTDTKMKPKAKTRTKRAQTGPARRAMQDEGSNTIEGNLQLDTVEEEEALRQKKRERYIEYGSDYDSEEERERIKREKKRKKKRKSKSSRNSPEMHPSKSAKSHSKSPNSEKFVRFKSGGHGSPSSHSMNAPHVRSTKSVPVHGARYEYSSDSDSGPRTRTRNVRTGTLEPDRYDADGNRIPTTKELMARYKKQNAKPSVELTYKVGGNNSRKNSNAHSHEDSEATTDSELSEEYGRSRKGGRSETMDATFSRSKGMKDRQKQRPTKFLRNNSRESKGRNSRPRSARYSDVKQANKRSVRMKNRRSYRETDSDTDGTDE